MAKQAEKSERIEYRADKKSAQKVRSLLMKILSKDKKSDGIGFSYTYKSFGKKAEYVISGRSKTVLRCVAAFHKFILKEEKKAKKREAEGAKATPIARGSYYTMKPLKERKRRNV